tara:strand:- start:3 stop:197 length:195 start_codon:yes stop_codon:yes gene_type:complete
MKPIEVFTTPKVRAMKENALKMRLVLRVELPSDKRQVKISLLWRLAKSNMQSPKEIMPETPEIP